MQKEVRFKCLLPCIAGQQLRDGRQNQLYSNTDSTGHAFIITVNKHEPQVQGEAANISDE